MLRFSLKENNVISMFVYSRLRASVLAAVSSLTFCLLNQEVAEELYEDGGGER